MKDILKRRWHQLCRNDAAGPMDGVPFFVLNGEVEPQAVYFCCRHQSSAVKRPLRSPPHGRMLWRFRFDRDRRVKSETGNLLLIHEPLE